MTRWAAVLGSPVSGSLSPVLHSAAYAALGLDWRYEAVECDAAALPATLDRLAGTHAGLSLTMPLKTAAVPLLDELAGRAAVLAAVNTVVFAGGRRIGHNTDVTGVQVSLDLLAVPAGTPGGPTRAPEPVVVLGAGGAARAVLAALAGRGVRDVAVLRRDPAADAALADLGGRLGLRVTPTDWAGATTVLPAAGLVVSAVPRGATVGLAASLRRWPGATRLLDLAYGAGTAPLLELARAAGAPAYDGFPMLVAQAGEQVRLMTGHEPPIEAMRTAGRRAAAVAAGQRPTRVDRG